MMPETCTLNTRITQKELIKTLISIVVLCIDIVQEPTLVVLKVFGTFILFYKKHKEIYE